MPTEDRIVGPGTRRATGCSNLEPAQLRAQLLAVGPALRWLQTTPLSDRASALVPSGDRSGRRVGMAPRRNRSVTSRTERMSTSERSPPNSSGHRSHECRHEVSTPNRSSAAQRPPPLPWRQPRPIRHLSGESPFLPRTRPRTSLEPFLETSLDASPRPAAPAAFRHRAGAASPGPSGVLSGFSLSSRSSDRRRPRLRRSWPPHRPARVRKDPPARCRPDIRAAPHPADHPPAARTPADQTWRPIAGATSVGRSAMYPSAARAFAASASARSDLRLPPLRPDSDHGSLPRLPAPGLPGPASKGPVPGGA